MSGRYTFKRMNGEEFTINLRVDERALAEHMARSMAMKGKRTATIGSGAVQAYLATAADGAHVK